MKNAKTTRRALFSSVIALMLCFTMLMGTTFAWFTDSVSSVGNKIQSGTLKIDLLHGEVSLKDETDHKVFDYDKWEPGYTRVETLTVVNEGNLALKYMLTVFSAGGEKLGANGENLANVIDVYMFNDAADLDRADIAAATPVGTLAELMADPDGAAYGVLLPTGATATADIEVVGSQEVTIALKMREEAGNEYQGLSVGNLYISLVATQYTYETDSFDNKYDELAEYPEVELPVDEWDGTVDTSWYNDTDTEFALNTAEQVAGLAELVDGGNNFEGKTIKLERSVDLYAEDANGEPICFDPIGSYRNDTAFKGTFDGQGNTISNLYQNTWALDNGYYYGDLGLGLFALVEDATIKDVNVDGADISGESALVGIVAATAYGDCTFENITVSNSKAADYQYYAGGIVGWASGDHEYINCDVDETTAIGGQWGDFNNANGGIIGGCSSSATILLKGCDVACQIDVHNDVVSAYHWYSYRRSGMLIGDSNATVDSEAVTTAAAPYLTCENVTVTYGDWANYTYCEFGAMGYPYVRVQAGISCDAYSNIRYGHPTDANGNTVVDDNHVHNDGEDHNVLIAFDQLYGGDTGDRYCTYGATTHTGVTVIYNNK